MTGGAYEPESRVPTDKQAEKAWNEIMKIASENALIVQAFSGTATLALPAEQRKAGIRERVLRSGLFELERGVHEGEEDR